ncbi:TetR/AcrR family transcriptional regulator [Loigolactobacillus binensis]|uniref:TetR/AcrR family transcriptional regulator n=1 Tax=Loigolactobacillus binensis TaxID=2559922 RepID=A0ABW3ECS6_9LACO|nr:TetR/AcrR family transcriptional regulator [Loigolactobacillus binensis]
MKLKNEQLRQNIILATTDLIIAQGFAGTSTVKVAKQAKTAQSNIYRYFENRQTLLLAVFKYHQQKLIAALAPLLDTTAAPLVQIDGLINAMIQFSLTDFDTMRVLALFRDQPNMRPLLPKISEDTFFAQLFKLIKHYQELKVVKPYYSEFLAAGVFSLIMNYALAVALDEIPAHQLTQQDVVALIHDFLLVK